MSNFVQFFLEHPVVDVVLVTCLIVLYNELGV